MGADRLVGAAGGLDQPRFGSFPEGEFGKKYGRFFRQKRPFRKRGVDKPAGWNHKQSQGIGPGSEHGMERARTLNLPGRRGRGKPVVLSQKVGVLIFRHEK